MQSAQKGERAIASALPPAIKPILLSVPASANYLGLSPASIYRLLGVGRLKAVKAGAKTLLTVASLQDYAASLPSAKIRPPTKRMSAAAAKVPAA